MKKILLLLALFSPFKLILAMEEGIQPLDKKLIRSIKENGSVGEIHELIKKGAYVNAENWETGEIPLLIAIEEDNFEICKLLIENDANVNDINRYDQTPLSIAVGRGHVEIVSLLIENDADLNANDNKGQTPLQSAACNGLTDICKLLIDNGAKVNTKDSDGFTPLIWAAESGHLAVCELLFLHGAKVNAQNNFKEAPLIKAAHKGHLDIAKILIKNNADVNTKDIYGHTPLIFASQSGSLDLCKLLIEKGADVNAALIDGFFKGHTPLMCASQNGHLEVCKLLIENGAKVKTKNHYGTTALSLAIEKGHVDLCRLLISHTFIVPKIENLKESQKRIEAALLSFKRKTKFSKDVQYLILQSNGELKKDLLNTLLAHIQRGGKPPVKLKNFLAKALTDSTIKELKLLTEEILKKDRSEDMRNLLNPDTLEETFKSSIYKNIRNRLQNNGMVVIPDQGNLQSHNDESNAPDSDSVKKSASWLSTRNCIIVAAITWAVYYFLSSSNTQDNSDAKQEILV